MLPINFKQQKINIQDLQTKLPQLNGKNKYESPNSQALKKVEQIELNKQSIQQRANKEDASPWVAKQAQLEAQSQFEQAQKRVQLLLKQEELTLAKQQSLEMKKQYLERIRQQKYQHYQDNKTKFKMKQQANLLNNQKIKLNKTYNNQKSNFIQTKKMMSKPETRKVTKILNKFNPQKKIMMNKKNISRKSQIIKVRIVIKQK
ncbi:hypothetical protein IMG5_000590 [Ichthyophthirius multifiliis]|uniref:Uncharacterized protein n=1 Tax=Ichthyophthirius multifiliis TaxID=5932 RepID=G0QIU5_ICHMU|nr:hypothetical protein IMG5_000590 [Ichthyophthirius multifiliis]EGR34831.1 hypothetical protein IMG5_000590 [Ichthyophthirius multifiliis]|eukprot:XP_004040135.1 hypothetical protein IMG5_000590 [Ichthyophthirius multifiliis]